MSEHRPSFILTSNYMLAVAIKKEATHFRLRKFHSWLSYSRVKTIMLQIYSCDFWVYKGNNSLQTNGTWLLFKGQPQVTKQL